VPFQLDENTVAGRVIFERGEARGQQEERTDFLALLMRRTFGPDERIAGLAERMAVLDRDTAAELALHAASLDDLDRTLPPHPGT